MKTRKEVAELLGLSERTIDNYRKKHDLPFVELPSGSIRFKEDDVLKWLHSKEKNRSNKQEEAK